MTVSHRERVARLLSEAELAHRDLLATVPADIRESLPVDAQGVTRAIDHIAAAAGLTIEDRRRLVTAHAVNPAVLHARVFGRAPLTEGTVIGAFVEGARVRADALVTLAEIVDQGALAESVRALLIDHPLPAFDSDNEDETPGDALRDAYAAQEQAALLIAAGLDER